MRARNLSFWLVAGAIAWAGAILSGSAAMAADPDRIAPAQAIAPATSQKLRFLARMSIPHLDPVTP